MHQGADAQPHLPAIPEWQSTIARDHPLTGRIFRPERQVPIPPESLVAALSRHDFVLLGETHDNPDHHALQAWVIAGLVAFGRRPAVALEMLDADQAPALARHLERKPPPDAMGLGDAVDWKARGWPDWSIYAPIGAVALRAELPLVAADLGRETRRRISRGGIAALSDEQRQRLGLATGFDTQQAASLARELRASHCGHLRDEVVPRMMDVQRARDANMAAAMIGADTAGNGNGAVLIAGAGHTRRDRGVPWHLARMAPDRSVVTLAFREVEHAATKLEEYGFDGAYDFVWFTPRHDDDDPCARFEDQLRRMRQP